MKSKSILPVLTRVYGELPMTFLFPSVHTACCGIHQWLTSPISPANRIENFVQEIPLKLSLASRTVAITPRKSKNFDFEIVRRVCQDCTLAGLKAMLESRTSGSSSRSSSENPSSAPFRFMYMSGAATERDQSKTPSYMPQYSLMRGETENRTLAYAAEHKGALEVCVAKPGLITAPGQYLKTISATVLNLVGVVPKLDVSEVSAAMLHQVVHGWEKEPLENADLVRIGRLALQGECIVMHCFILNVV